jgi:hypothetical protein
MSGFYVYLISSLPVLRFGAAPHFSLEKFIQICRDLVPEEDLEILRLSADIGRDFVYLGPLEALRNWCDFNIALNNEIVKIRAGRKHIDSAKFLRPDGYFSSDAFHIAGAACRNPSLLEAESILDQARWNYLEEISLGHYFDLELLLIYLQKLLILERWQRINRADKPELLTSVLM